MRIIAFRNVTIEFVEKSDRVYEKDDGFWDDNNPLTPREDMVIVEEIIFTSPRLSISFKVGFRLPGFLLPFHAFRKGRGLLE